jgi:hypothetical protein
MKPKIFTIFALLALSLQVDAMNINEAIAARRTVAAPSPDIRPAHDLDLIGLNPFDRVSYTEHHMTDPDTMESVVIARGGGLRVSSRAATPERAATKAKKRFAIQRWGGSETVHGSYWREYTESLGICRLVSWRVFAGPLKNGIVAWITAHPYPKDSLEEIETSRRIDILSKEINASVVVEASIFPARSAGGVDVDPRVPEGYDRRIAKIGKMADAIVLATGEPSWLSETFEKRFDHVLSLLPKDKLYSLGRHGRFPPDPRFSSSPISRYEEA